MRPAMVGTRWSLRVGGESLQLALARDAGADVESRLAPNEAAWAITTMSIGIPSLDAMIRNDLSRLLENVEGARGRARSSVADLLGAVASAVRDGRLVAFRTSRPIAVERPVKIERLGPQESDSTWIEIVLVDEETKEPLANERYRLETADGRIIEGTTNASGKAREEGITPGQCKVSWPDLAPEAWKAA